MENMRQYMKIVAIHGDDDDYDDVEQKENDADYLVGIIVDL